ncbi:MAG: cell division topological specificity factor MinE [Candidatus Sericytochromatia bacterium]
MGLFTIINNLLGRQNDQSKTAAKDRLRLVLMHDRSDIPATMMEAIRTEMVQVLSKYVEIDQEALEVMLEKEAGSIGLVLNIPIRRVKSEAEAAEALAAMKAIQDAKDGKTVETVEATVEAAPEAGVAEVKLTKAAKKASKEAGHEVSTATAEAAASAD